MHPSLQVETSAIGTALAVTADDPSIQPAQLRLAVEQLAQVRRDYADAKATKELAFNAWLTENLALVTRTDELKNQVAQMEVALRLLGVQRYKATEDTSPAPGLEVKGWDVVECDREAVERLARDRAVAVVIDWDALERIMKADPKSWPTVRIVKEPRSSIARDLDKALAIADATGEGA